MEPMLYMMYHHLGLAFAGKNEPYQAIQQLKIAYVQTGELEKAAEEFRTASLMDPAERNRRLDHRSIRFRQGVRLPNIPADQDERSIVPACHIVKGKGLRHAHR